MAAILQTMFLDALSWIKTFFYFDWNFTSVFPNGLIDSNTALV